MMNSNRYIVESSLVDRIDITGLQLLLEQQQKLFDHVNSVSDKISLRNYTLLGLLAGSFPLLIGQTNNVTLGAVLLLMYVLIGVLVYVNIKPRQSKHPGIDVRRYIDKDLVDHYKEETTRMYYIFAIEDAINDSEIVEHDNIMRAKRFSISLSALLLTWALYGALLVFRSS